MSQLNVEWDAHHLLLLTCSPISMSPAAAAAVATAEIANQAPPASNATSMSSSKKKKKATPNLTTLESHVSKAGWPVAPKVSSSKGRHVVATNALEPGDLVVQEQSYLVMAANRDVCATCFSFKNMEMAKKLNLVVRL